MLSWSSCVVDAGSGRVVAAEAPDVPLSVASVGKLVLLCEVAARLRAEPDVVVARTPDDRVADSGLWQHLAIDELPARDAAVLVAAHSDNLATNVLLRWVGLDAVAARGVALGLQVTALHDRVRDERGPGDPPRLATGCAGELARLACSLDGDVVAWLRTNTDLSMVPMPFGLDPLAHPTGLWNKTGTDAGVRADVGVVAAGGRALAYAAIANWDPAEDRRDEALARMHALGADLRARLAEVASAC